MKPCRRITSNWALWVCVAALILRAAMPLLANASAQAQGRAMVEVCSVYGVSLMPLDGSAHDQNHTPEPMTAHAGDHCALSALAALAAPSVPPVSAGVMQPRLTTGPPCARSSGPAHDACAHWIARRKHGPPADA